MDDQIVLDRDAFRALSSETRVGMIKSLKERRKTLSELSEELKISASTASEHLDILEKYGLVKKIDEGRKWKYYELTDKGNKIMKPYGFNAIVVLSIILVIAVSAYFFTFYVHSPSANMLTSAVSAKGAQTATGESAGDYSRQEAQPLATEVQEKNEQSAIPPQSSLLGFPYLKELAIILAVLIVVAAFAYYLFFMKNKKKSQ